jgi:hypothetical protein
MLAAIQATAGNASGGGMAAPPITEYNLDCGVFADDNDLDHDAEGAIIFNMSRWYSSLPGVVLPSSHSLVAAGVAMPGAEQFSVNAAGIAGAVVAGAAGAGYTPAAIPNPEHRNYALMCASGEAHGIQYAIDLIACMQVKPLKNKNIKGYFMSQDGTKVGGGAIREWLEPVAKIIPKLAGDPIIAARLTQNKFMTYHLGFSSTANILTEMVAFLGGPVNAVVSPATVAAITASSQAPHSQPLNALIPEMAILAGMAYSKALKKDVGEWYQGEHAKGRHPASAYNSYYSLFYRMAELSDASVVLLVAPDVAALIAAMPANLMGC